MKCQVIGCREEVYAKSLCEKHYWRQRRHGDPSICKTAPRQKCSVDGCDRWRYSHGFCRLHHRRFQKYGDPHKVAVIRMPGRKCSIPGCGRSYNAKGLCAIHYQRWIRHGIPLDEPKIAPAGAPLGFLEMATTWERDECLYWPFSREGGYARISRNLGLGQNVCRIICERLHGPPPTPKHEAAHSCGKGHMGCVSGSHLRWATAKENGAEKVTHGRVRRGSTHSRSKLTEDQVREIRSLEGQMKQADIARRFGVNHDTISSIYRGRSWSWLT